MKSEKPVSSLSASKCNLYRYPLVSVIDASLDAKEAVTALDEAGPPVHVDSP
jgi:hypothetical protein